MVLGTPTPCVTEKVVTGSAVRPAEDHPQLYAVCHSGQGAQLLLDVFNYIVPAPAICGVVSVFLAKRPSADRLQSGRKVPKILGAGSSGPMVPANCFGNRMEFVCRAVV